jgi:surfeit locus 1 family protein
MAEARPADPRRPEAPGGEADERPHRPLAFRVLVVGAVLAALAFVALGLWQLQRLQWKQALIARVEARIHAPAAPAPGPLAWSDVDRDSAEYRRVRVAGRFDHGRETLVQAATELGSGWWVLTPLRVDGGWWLLVNRGFVPPDMRDPARRPAAPQGEVEVVGLLRIDEPGGTVLQTNDPTANRWYSRDVRAIGQARQLEEGAQAAPLAPYFIDQTAPPDASPATLGFPRAGLTVLRFSNNHLQYALTWFAMAAGAVGVIVFLLRDERRHRRQRAGHADRRR